MKPLKSKTVNFGVLVAILGAAQANLVSLQDIISPTAYGWATFFIGVTIVGLRAVTTEPLSEK